MNLEIKAKIVEANLGIVDINGFKYNLHNVQVGTFDKFAVLLPIFNDVSVGDCFSTKDWFFTRLKNNPDPTNRVLRVDKFELCASEGFEVSQYLNGKVTGIFLNSDKCYLRTVGPSAKPFYMATIKIKDEFGEGFDNPIVAFGNQAKKMSTIVKCSVIECEVTVKSRRDQNGYELAAMKIEVKQEGR